jgi:uncharacterized membrane protein
VEVLSEIFRHLCGRGRCFVAGGEALPLCQRCLGLYVGAAATALWLAASGTWRRGLPSRSVLLAHLAMLAAGILGGLHVIDAGPAWRVACGLWTGHVAAVWLFGGASALRRPQRQLPWRRGDNLQALAGGPVLAVLGLAIPHLMWLGAGFWSVAAAAGAAVLAAGVAAAVAAVGAHLVAALRAGPATT